MILQKYDYINIPQKTNDVVKDVANLLRCNGREDTLLHAEDVARVNGELADRFGLSREKCIIAALLHDISVIVTPEDMMRYAIENHFEICEAERRFPFLLHQRFSRLIASEFFEITDTDILSAIECHTSLKASPSPSDMALFIADKLAWDQEGIPPYYDVVDSALDKSLEKACYVFMTFVMEHKMLLYPHTNWTLAYDFLKEKCAADA
ncbi:MAG: HD domain-containing protein [Bacillota bacterium]|nr:HD domain-containing protein [Bacillota bacterium]